MELTIKGSVIKKMAKIRLVITLNFLYFRFKGLKNFQAKNKIKPKTIFFKMPCTGVKGSISPKHPQFDVSPFTTSINNIPVNPKSTTAVAIQTFLLKFQ